ncbi:hypothetical protein DP57_5950 [Burkholderia pseudomallei]|nr:hypothetical protein DP57_5950 [Burkholderia pseudomallei]
MLIGVAAPTGAEAFPFRCTALPYLVIPCGAFGCCWGG